MSRTTRPSRSRSSPVTPQPSSLDGLLVSFARLLIERGESPSSLAERFTQACRQAASCSAQSDRDVSRYLIDLTRAVGLWFSEPAYQIKGVPRPLPLTGKGPTLTKLLRRVFPQGDLAPIVSALLISRCVKKVGRQYHVLSEHVSFAEDQTHGQVHALDSVTSLLATAQWNMDCADPEDRLLERSATNAAIPIRELNQVHARFKREMHAVLLRLDRYLNDIAVPPGSEPVAFVRLGVYEAVEPMVRRAAHERRRPHRRRRGAVR